MNFNILNLNIISFALQDKRFQIITLNSHEISIVYIITYFNMGFILKYALNKYSFLQKFLLFHSQRSNSSDTFDGRHISHDSLLERFSLPPNISKPQNKNKHHTLIASKQNVRFNNKTSHMMNTPRFEYRPSLISHRMELPQSDETCSIH